MVVGGESVSQALSPTTPRWAGLLSVILGFVFYFLFFMIYQREYNCVNYILNFYLYQSDVSHCY